MKSAQIRKASFRLWVVASILWGGFGAALASENESTIIVVAVGSFFLGVLIGGLGWVASAFFDE